MPPPVIFRPAAETELREAYSRYEDQLPGLGDRFATVVDETIQRIRDRPHLYARIHGEIRRALTPRFPYGIFYVAESDRVVVIAVFHGRRDPKRWMGRR